MLTQQLKKNYAAEYEELTNAVQAAALEQLTAHELQEWNRTTAIQSLIKRMWNNTRSNFDLHITELMRRRRVQPIQMHVRTIQSDSFNRIYKASESNTANSTTPTQCNRF